MYPNDLSAIDALADSRTDIAAIMVEPIMGEGGIRPLQTDYLQGLHARCAQTGLVAHLRRSANR